MNAVAIKEQNETNKLRLILMTPLWSLKLLHSPSSGSRNGDERGGGREEGRRGLYCQSSFTVRLRASSDLA